MGMVNKNKTSRNENNRPRKRFLSGSIGFGRPRVVRHLLIKSMFQEAPMMRPYAKIVGAMNISMAKASQVGVSVPPSNWYPYAKTSSVLMSRNANVVMRRMKSPLTDDRTSRRRDES